MRPIRTYRAADGRPALEEDDADEVERLERDDVDELADHEHECRPREHVCPQTRFITPPETSNEEGRTRYCDPRRIVERAELRDDAREGRGDLARRRRTTLAEQAKETQAREGGTHDRAVETRQEHREDHGPARTHNSKPSADHTPRTTRACLPKERPQPHPREHL